LLPIHWGTFNLAPHPWAEPAEWTKDLGDASGTRIAFPRPGQPFEPAGELPTEPWWRAVSHPITRPWRRPVGTTRVVRVPGDDLDLAGER
ncbi:MBL fold metallo-hydrolase, partial [Streptomyces sp. SID11233]|nr:MBL fold metallo-hydrolase [Streptomyces sp. SID11233]